MAQPLALSQLSKAQQINLHKNHGNDTIVDLYQLEDNKGVKYYAVVENDVQRIILRTAPTRWTVVKTTRK